MLPMTLLQQPLPPASAQDAPAPSLPATRMMTQPDTGTVSTAIQISTSSPQPCKVQSNGDVSKNSFFPPDNANRPHQGNQFLCEQ